MNSKRQSKRFGLLYIADLHRNHSWEKTSTNSYPSLFPRFPCRTNLIRVHVFTVDTESVICPDASGETFFRVGSDSRKPSYITLRFCQLIERIMHRPFQRFFTTLRERSCVSYAKIAAAGGFGDVELILVKATAPDNAPLPERYIHELLRIFSVCPSSFRAFSLSFTRRFGKTRCWRVALKCLVLVHRLLHSLPADSPFRAELLWARTNGLLPLYPCRFLDLSSSHSVDYSVFVRSYAQLIDEALGISSLDSMAKHCQGGQEEEDDEDNNELSEGFPEKMREIGRMLEVLPQVQSLIDRAMDCRPTGAAAESLLVGLAMEHVIRDSFVCYITFRRDIVAVLESLFQMPYRSCIAAFGIYKKASLQASQLGEFYKWCMSKGLCGSYEYPLIDRIPPIQVRALETFINGMWQLTESSSSATSPSSLEPSQSSSSTEDNNEMKTLGREIRFEDDGLQIQCKEEEEEPLIRLEEESTGDDDWETLLDASVNLSPAYKAYCMEESEPGNGHGTRLGYKDELKLQTYDPAATRLNPFNYQHGTQFDHGGPWIMMLAEDL